MPQTRDRSRSSTRVQGPYVDDAAGLVDEYFVIANQLATTFQSRVYFSLRTIYTLAVLLGLSFLLYSDFENMEYMIWAFLIFFSGGVILYLIARRLEWHRKYLDYRALVEGLRALFYWRVVRVTDESGTAFIHDNFLQNQDIEVGWIRNVMRVLSVTTRKYDGKTNAGGLNHAIEHWIGQQGPGGLGQLSYLETTSRARTRPAPGDADSGTGVRLDRSDGRRAPGSRRGLGVG